MTVQSRKRYMTIASVLMVVGSLFVACLFWIRGKQRQYAINRELIDALVKQDENRALLLVNAGADPNTPYQPPPVPSIKDMWNLLLHREHPQMAYSPTAFMMVCGAFVKKNNYEFFSFGPDAPQLVEAMLKRGGKIDAVDERKVSTLTCAIQHHKVQTSEILIKDGVNVNSKDEHGWTPLMAIMVSNSLPWPTLRLLFANGVDVNSQNDSGRTALYYCLDEGNETPKVVRQLLEHGASPYLPDNKGDTPLKAAQRYHLTSLVALIQHRSK